MKSENFQLSSQKSFSSEVCVAIGQKKEKSTPKPRSNEPRYSEFCDIVNKTQFPFGGFIKHITFDIVNYSI